jgi:hypothetical protein
MLLSITQSKIGEQFRRKRQWDDAVDWLKAGLVTLHRSQSRGRTAQKLADNLNHELKKAQQRRSD